MFLKPRGGGAPSRRPALLQLPLILLVLLGTMVELSTSLEDDYWYYVSFNNVDEWKEVYPTCDPAFDFQYDVEEVRYIHYASSEDGLGPAVKPLPPKKKHILSLNKTVLPNHLSPISINHKDTYCVVRNSNRSSCEGLKRPPLLRGQTETSYIPEPVLKVMNNRPPKLGSYFVSYGFIKNKLCLIADEIVPCHVSPQFGKIRGVVVTADRPSLKEIRAKYTVTDPEKFVSIRDGGNNAERVFYETIFMGTSDKIKCSDKRSSHIIDGKCYPLEIYLYFVNEAYPAMAGTTILVVLVEEQDKENPYVRPVVSAVSKGLYDEERSFLTKELGFIQYERMYHHMGPSAVFRKDRIKEGDTDYFLIPSSIEVESLLTKQYDLIEKYLTFVETTKLRYSEYQRMYDHGKTTVKDVEKYCLKRAGSWQCPTFNLTTAVPKMQAYQAMAAWDSLGLTIKYVTNELKKDNPNAEIPRMIDALNDIILKVGSDTARNQALDKCDGEKDPATGDFIDFPMCITDKTEPGKRFNEELIELMVKVEAIFKEELLNISLSLGPNPSKMRVKMLNAFKSETLLHFYAQVKAVLTSTEWLAAVTGLSVMDLIKTDNFGTEIVLIFGTFFRKAIDIFELAQFLDSPSFDDLRRLYADMGFPTEFENITTLKGDESFTKFFRVEDVKRFLRHYLSTSRKRRNEHPFDYHKLKKTEKAYDNIEFGNPPQTERLLLGNLGMSMKTYEAYEKLPPETARVRQNFQVSWLLPKGGGYYRYKGSSPVPPCFGASDVIVFKKPIKMSKKQIEILSRVPTSKLEARNINNTFGIRHELRETMNERASKIFFDPRNHQFLGNDDVHKNSVLEYYERRNKNKGGSSQLTTGYWIYLHLYTVLYILWKLLNSV